MRPQRSRQTPSLLSQAGFSFVEVVLAGGVSMLVALGMATMQSNQAKSISVMNSQNSKVTLAAALRTQLSRRATCLPSFVTRPAQWNADSDVAVLVGPNNPADLVRGGNEMRQWNLTVDSLRVKNLAPAGTTSSGATLVLGTIALKTSSRQLNSGQQNSKVSFKEEEVAKVLFEVTGGVMTGCYAQSAELDVSSNFQTLCELTTSPRDPAARGRWVTDHCEMPTPSAASECAALGGALDAGGSCTFPPNVSCTRMGGSWDGTNCVWPAASCVRMGGSWNGSSCQWPATAPSTTCAQLGGSWDGSRCVTASNPPSGASTCGSMGGSWNGSSCVLPTNAPDGASVCGSIGGTWNGSGCQTASGPNAHDNCTDGSGTHAHGTYWMGKRGGNNYIDCNYVCVEGVTLEQTCYDNTPSNPG